MKLKEAILIINENMKKKCFAIQLLSILAIIIVSATGFFSNSYAVSLIATIPTDVNPVCVTYTSNFIYVTNIGSNSLSVIDPTTNRVVSTIPVGINPYGVTYDSFNGKIYVANYGSSDVSVIDTATNSVVATISIATAGPIGITYDSTNNDIYVTGLLTNMVYVIDPATNSLVGSPILVGSGPAGEAVSTLNNSIYVTNSISNTVSVIDATTNTIASTIPVGTNPNGITYDSFNGKIYVANSGSNSISVLDPILPSLTSVSIKSNNANPSFATIGDTVTVSITSNKDIQSPTIQIAGNTATVSGSGTSWSATYVMTSSDTEGMVPIQINAMDFAGNAAAPVASTTDGTQVTFDKTAPSLTSVSITSNNANPSFATIGDTVTVSITSNENILTPTIQIAGYTATVSGYDKSWTATHVMTPSDTSGIIPIQINAMDLTGNTAISVTATTDGTQITFDNTPLDPPLSLVVPSDMKLYSSHEGKKAIYSVTVSGGFGTSSVICSPPSGSKFPVGSTIVTCTATDSAKNSVIKSFHITVIPGDSDSEKCGSDSKGSDSALIQFDSDLKQLHSDLKQWDSDLKNYNLKELNSDLKRWNDDLKQWDSDVKKSNSDSNKCGSHSKNSNDDLKQWDSFLKRLDSKKWNSDFKKWDSDVKEWNHDSLVSGSNSNN